MSSLLFGIIKFSDKLYISIFSFFALIPVIICQGIVYSFIFVSAIAIHEFSHIFFLNHFGVPVRKIAVFPFGIDINADTSRISYKKELICTLAGSFSNILFALFGGVILSVSPSPLLLFFVICNIFLGTLNLIPMSFFDGGKALRLLIYDAIHPDTAFYVYRFLDIFSAAIFISFSIFLIFISNFNFSVCAVMLYAAISTLSNQNRQKTP